MPLVSISGPGSRYYTASESEPEPTEWQLEAGHYFPAKLEQLIVYPRPDDEAATWARHRLAPSGIALDFPISVQGGAPPFEYALTDDDGADGAIVGEHLGDDWYGRFYWANPVAGTYEITVRVRSQEYGRNTSEFDDESTVTFTLVVRDREDTDYFIWLDSANGSDSTGDGSYSNPFASLDQVYSSTSHGSKQLFLKAGTYDTDGANQFPANGSSRPAVIVGVGDVTINYTQRNFSVSSSDFFAGHLNITEGGWGAALANPRYFTCTTSANRLTWYEVHGSELSNGSNGNDNPSMIFLSGGIGGPRQYVSVSHCSEVDRPSGSSNSGLLHIFFYTQYAVTEWCTTRGGGAQGSCIYKDTNPDTTERFCDMRQTSGDRVMGAGGYDVGVDTERVEFCYNFASGPHSRMNWSAGSDHGACYVYRCTLRHTVGSVTRALSILNPDTTGPYVVENNVVQSSTTAIDSGSNVTLTDNLTGSSGLINEDGELQGTNHDNYYGTRGWQVA